MDEDGEERGSGREKGEVIQSKGGWIQTRARVVTLCDDVVGVSVSPKALTKIGVRRTPNNAK